LLSPNYPKVRIPIHTKLELDQEFLNEKSGTAILRLTFTAIITDENVWIESNYQKLFKRFPEVIHACYGNFSDLNFDKNLI
jgi:hypothetical protein